MAKLTNKDRMPYEAWGAGLQDKPFKSQRMKDIEFRAKMNREAKYKAAREKANVDRFKNQKATIDRDDFLRVYADAVRKRGQQGGYILHDRSIKPKR